jgi:hypothetical protein
LSFRKIARIAHSPVVEVITGLVLVGSAIVEMFSATLEKLLNFHLGLEHGVLALGVLHMLKALPGLLEGISKIEEGEEKRSREMEDSP